MKPAAWSGGRARCWKCLRFVLAAGPREDETWGRTVVKIDPQWHQAPGDRLWWHESDPKRPSFVNKAPVTLMPELAPGELPQRPFRLSNGTVKRRRTRQLPIATPLVMVCPRDGARCEVDAPPPSPKG